MNLFKDKYDRICHKCWLFTNKYEDKELDFELFKSDYTKLLAYVLKRWFKVGSSAAAGIINGLGCGNWEHLWETEDEKMQTDQEIVNYICKNIYYCGDRWSWDRVLRINWEFRRLCWRNWKNKNHSAGINLE